MSLRSKKLRASQVVVAVKNLPANAGDPREMGPIIHIHYIYVLYIYVLHIHIYNTNIVYPHHYQSALNYKSQCSKIEKRNKHIDQKQRNVTVLINRLHDCLEEMFIESTKKFLELINVLEGQQGIRSTQKYQSCFYALVSEVTQSRLTFCNSVDCSLPGSFVDGIFQGRVPEQVAIFFSRESS